jgi:hypothetical protein
MQNVIKKYLEMPGKSFETLKNELGISYTIFEDMVILSYSQIDSPKTDPIVRMCRGIVLDVNTYEIISMPFYRFYNFEEVLEEREKFDWAKAVATEKIDGSLISCFEHNGKWYIATRSKIGGGNFVGDNIHTFMDMFITAIEPLSFDEFVSKLNKNYCYTFELVSPFNRIVTEYKETKIYLIGCRDRKQDFKEIAFFDIADSSMPYLVPKVIPLVDAEGNFRGFDEMKGLAESLNQFDEGFVVTDFSNLIDGNFPRVKVKNSAYVALHHLRGTLENGSLAYHNILNIVYKHEQDEVCASLPHYSKYIREVEAKWNKFVEIFNADISNDINNSLIDLNFDFTDSDKKREFAMLVKDLKYKSILFMLLKLHSNNIRDFIDSQLQIKKSETVFKNLWEEYVSKMKIED